MSSSRTTYTTPHRAREWLAAVIPELEGMTMKGGETAAEAGRAGRAAAGLGAGLAAMGSSTKSAARRTAY